MRFQLQAKTILNLWLIGFVVGFVVQTFIQAPFARTTNWGYSDGWQSEIAIWNVGMILVILFLQHKAKFYKKLLIASLTVLSFLLGTNHFIVAVSNPTKWGNWLSSGLNFLIVFLAVTYLILASKTQSS